MMTTWIPTWVAAVWTLAFLLAAGVHLRHTLSMDGASRWWHATHVLMALGMIDMFWPYRPMPVGTLAGEIVFAVAGCGALAFRVAMPPGDASGFLWEVTIVDLFAMTYMFAELAHDNVVLVLALSAWFALETVGWLSGSMSWAARSAGLAPGPQVVSRSVGEPAIAAGPESTSLRPGQVNTRTKTAAPTRLTVIHEVPDPSAGVTVRFTLAVMSAGMTFMLLAVHFGGMAAGGQMQMPGM